MTIVHLMKGNVVEGAFGSYTVGQRHDIVPGPVKDGRWVVQRRPRMCSCDLNKGPRHDDRFVPSGGLEGVGAGLLPRLHGLLAEGGGHQFIVAKGGR